MPQQSTDSLRLMFWRIDLQTAGPGLALRDILAQAPRPALVAQTVAHIRPDILVLSGLDYDYGLVTLTALRELVAQQGHRFDHLHAYPSNAGLRTGLDLNGDRRADTPDDSQGYGAFIGQKGLALLSRVPINIELSRDYSKFLWADFPDGQSPHATDGPMADAAVNAVQRLPSVGHWDVVLQTEDGPLHLLIWQAGPPAFGGVGPRNALRNHDETAFWTAFLDGRLPMTPPDSPFILMGGSNLDPFDGDGRGDAMRKLLTHPAVQDPQPSSSGATISSMTDPRSASHIGPHGLDTVHWPQDNGPGNLRVSYILPSVGQNVQRSGVFWPGPDDPLAALLGTDDTRPSRHRPVWVDVVRDVALNRPARRDASLHSLHVSPHRSDPKAASARLARSAPDATDRILPPPDRAP